MPDRARAQICEAISAAEASKDMLATGAALTYACSLYKELREPANVKEVAGRLAKFGAERQLQGSSATASVYLGWALADGSTSRRHTVDRRRSRVAYATRIHFSFCTGNS
jgi:hypothetical protein